MPDFGSVALAKGTAFSRCPLCDCQELEYEFVVEESPVSRCTACSLVFLNPQPGLEAPPNVGFGREADSKPVELETWKAHLDLLEAYSGSVPRSLLAIGVPGGGLAEEAGRRGIELTELTLAELDAGALVPFAREPFDGCILDRSLERTSDPAAALSALRGVLLPQGVLLVCAISVASAPRRNSPKWPGFRRFNRFYFEIDTLQALLIKCGFTDPVTYPESLAPNRSDHLTIVVRPKLESGLPKLSIIVPVFNERATFSTMMATVIAKRIDGLDREIIIIESNSTDGSRAAVLEYRDEPAVRIILEDKPSGKGHAVRTGLKHVTGDIVLFQDADLEYDVDDYDALLRPLLAYEKNFVIGSRHNARGESWKIRSFNNAPILTGIFNVGHVFFQTLLNMLYKQSLKDPFSMYKVFRTECIYGLEFECNRFDFDHEIVVKLVRKGYRPVEVPVNYNSRSIGEGKKVSLFGDPLTWVCALLKFRKSQLYALKAKGERNGS
jgi:glycosyltransferase involved in cell wall biosynthesis